MTAEENIIYNTLYSKEYMKKSGYWYGIKCPFCGDTKTPKSVHLFIRLGGDNNVAMTCYKLGCDVSRRMSVADALKLGVTDSSVLKMLADNKNIKNINKTSSGINNILLSEVFKPEIASYFKSRTLIDVDKAAIEKYSIVGCIDSFIDLNKTTIHKDIQKKLLYLKNKYPKGFIGFLNRDRTLMYIRNIDEESKDKHDKMSLSEDFIIHSPYEIRHNVDYKQKDFIIFHNEGCFDAINISKHISGGVPHYSIASLGFSHMFGVMRYYSAHYRDVTTVINRDGDINPTIVEKYLSRYKYRYQDVYWVYNTESKDIGDMRLPINPVKEKITLL